MKSPKENIEALKSGAKDLGRGLAGMASGAAGLLCHAAKSAYDAVYEAKKAHAEHRIHKEKANG